MNKTVIVLIVSNETGSGKSHMSFSTGDTFVIDMTPDKDGEIAALHVFGDGYEERYKCVKDYEEMIKLIAETEHKVICLETGDAIRDVLAGEFLKRVNTVRKEKGKEPVNTIYPTTEWGKVYEIGKELFYKYCGKKSFIITEGTKDKWQLDMDSGKEVNTGKKVPDGLKMLPGACDIMVNIVIEKGKRKIVVMKNRFVDKVGNGWINEAKDLNDLFDKMDEKGIFKKEWLVM